MRIQKTLHIGEHQVTVQELTVSDIRGLLVTSLVGQAIAEDGDQQADLIMRNALLADLTLDELAAMTNLSPAGLDGFSQSELQQLVDACRDLNPLFFGMRARLAAARQQAEMEAIAAMTWPSS
ncbi:hypothetical protein HA052_22860 [Chromobacterium haemolyticum]|uniref:Phage tail assembly protein n=1 Tax=Chromobacterium fluminis TaxID=3044269 RepID=A0ABX0L8K0_9NEIS|nr:hypothetical protein [Chromobacterium haemolyticum]NHR08035.1 hypothetical protein [Chromobacterium haemolyticum]